MGQPDLSSNSLISYPDVFADIINATVYKGKQVIGKNNLKPYYTNSSAAKVTGKLRGLYRDVCMEDTRNGIRYIIWGIENQYVLDYTIPFKVMGYDYSAYDRQIEDYAAQNKSVGDNAYVNTLLPNQKLKPVITIVLYYGADDIPRSICDMIDMPEDADVREYIQNYSLNMVKLRSITKEQAEKFKSDFACIAKFLSKSYNKKEQIELLKNDRQVLIHTKDILYALAAITKDDKYLQISENSKEESEVCEIAEAFVQLGIEQGIEQGIQSGKAAGIIEMGRDMKLTDSEIIDKLQKKLNTSIEKAQEYLRDFDNPSK